MSPPLDIYTQRWGDVTRPFQERIEEIGITQPDVLDLSAVLDRVRLQSFSMLKPMAQLWSQRGQIDIDAELSVLEISTVIDAIRRMTYPNLGACECPTTTPCPLRDPCGRCAP